MPKRQRMTKRRWQREKRVFAKLVREGRAAASAHEERGALGNVGHSTAPAAQLDQRATR